MSLVELIAQADERGLAASGLACLDRCVPVLGADDDLLRPLWASLADGGDWGGPLAAAREALAPAAQPPGAAGEAVALARRMLDAVPAVPAVPGAHGGAEVREWADGCSVAALQVHRILDTAPDGAGRSVRSRREGRTDSMSPLVAAELRRQIRILELLANRGAGPAGGLRQALDVSMEGRRVLRAVVSRRARGRG
ncbi:hypothetical protein [Streptomyces kanamyceticus]|uniref:Uncharacterized protein n=1 Tax=Streptomyces kanamyceticus TaxID=1967 RepID=A0A5J6G908_STRKN|nr:hypothetical protein [Streptomyces kanamyceticus]QEU92280.1 hypothetical protein CP970_16420 [Streptomyces kanamyceticus]